MKNLGTNYLLVFVPISVPAPTWPGLWLDESYYCSLQAKEKWNISLRKHHLPTAVAQKCSAYKYGFHIKIWLKLFLKYIPKAYKLFIGLLLSLLSHLVRTITHLLIASLFIVCYTKKRCKRDWMTAWTTWIFRTKRKYSSKIPRLVPGLMEYLIFHMLTDDVLHESNVSFKC